MDGDSASSDVIEFGTDGWRAPLSVFTAPRVRMVGQAVATYLDDEGLVGPVAIGYDAREHSRTFAEELARVLAVNGRAVTIASRDCPTPVLAWTVAQGSFAGGLVITASHNPPEYNGVKFVPASGVPALPAVTDAIEERLATPKPLDSETHESITERDLSAPYLDHAQEFVADTLLDDETKLSSVLSGTTVAYDAMHGSGRGVTDRLLTEAGATVEKLRCEQDPAFGGVAPEPGPEHALELVDRVTNGGADLGVINDGDADRIGLVTPGRGYLDPNVVLALIYEVLLETQNGDAVRTVSTSSLVDRVGAAHGRQVHETAVGFKWVAEAMAEHDTLVGGEESGGYGITTHLQNKDGVLLALLAAAADAKRPLDDRLDALLESYGSTYQDRLSVDCPPAQKSAVLARLEDTLPDSFAGRSVADVTTVDGFKVHLDDGSWLLIRPSGTEPKLRVYAEADSDGGVQQLLAAGNELVTSRLEGE